MAKQKVITVNGDSGKWYDKVIFVVKNEGVIEMKGDLLEEAEKIISEYMLKGDMAYTNKGNNSVKSTNTKSAVSNKQIDFFLYCSISACLILLSVLLLTSMF